MENSKKNLNTSSSNNNIDHFISKTADLLKYGKREYNNLQQMIRNTPLQIKIANFVVPFTLTYIFTFVYFNLPLSIIFAIITVFVISFLSKLMSVIFQILYIILLIGIIKKTKSTLGIPILETDIVKTKIPYNCLNTSLTIPNSKLEQDLYGGYFTYSFWLYVNNGNDSDKANWNNYRYNEWKSIFYRGNAINDTGDLSSLIQFPGFWLTPVINNMVIVFQNGSYVERLEINNIPFNTWTNFTVVVETKSVSVYINGNLDRTLNLYQSITVMNSYNLYLTSDILTSKNKKESGFAGSVAELIYYNYALNAYDINKSYHYYKKIINKYQYKIDSQSNYKIPGLITNSDYFV
jgi:hypothetical protein